VARDGGAVMSEESVKRYPLEWPLGWKRCRSRRHGAFSMTREDRKPEGVSKRSTSINVQTATERLEKQLDMLGAKDPTLSTNVSLNLRGIPRGDENPSDPGAAIYFKFRGRATVLACDSYFRVADNIAALAAHIDALRRIERYGVGTIEQALAGYKALPADSAADWRAVFGFGKDSRPSVQQVQDAYYTVAKTKHPDAGGSDIEMAHVNRARDFALMEIEG
jgi:hypothetical protein